jgi:hypothetical protein
LAERRGRVALGDDPAGWRTRSAPDGRYLSLALIAQDKLDDAERAVRHGLEVSPRHLQIDQHMKGIYGDPKYLALLKRISA